MTGQDYDVDDAATEAVHGFAGEFDPSETPGLFGPAVEVDPDALLFDEVLARAGRSEVDSVAEPPALEPDCRSSRSRLSAFRS